MSTHLSLDQVTMQQELRQGRLTIMTTMARLAGSLWQLPGFEPSGPCGGGRNRQQFDDVLRPCSPMTATKDTLVSLAGRAETAARTCSRHCTSKHSPHACRRRYKDSLSVTSCSCLRMQNENNLRTRSGSS